jgi:hypothetical protein
MPTRTLTLSNIRYQLDGVTPQVGEQEYVYLQTPGGFPVTDLAGRVYFNGQPWGQSPVTNSSGVWTSTDVYPGDLRDGSGNALASPAQLVIVEGGSQTTLSPPGFAYAASITVSTWYPTATGSTAGKIKMVIDLALLDTTPDVGALVSYSISSTANTPGGTTYRGGVPIPEASNINGISAISLDPSSTLNPTTTAYLAQFNDATGTVWKFLAPVHPTGYAGAYAGGTTYHAGDGTKAGAASVVLWTDGFLYQYINATPGSGHDPTNATYWQLFPGEPVIWNRTDISGAGVPVIDTTGVRVSPSFTPLAGDPLGTPALLDDQLVDMTAEARARLRWLGAWSSATTYLANDVVSLSGADYICVLGNTNQTPPNLTYWTAIGGTVTSVTGTAPVTVATGTTTPVISISDFVASGASHARGSVPDPGATAGSTHYLREDGTWAIPAGGSSAFSFAVKTTTYTITTADSGIAADATGGSFTVTLPTAVGATQLYAIKKVDASANAVTLATTSSQTIDGASTVILTGLDQEIVVGSNGTNWLIAGGYTANPLLAKGDLIVGGVGGLATDFPVGANGTVLTADNTQPLNVKWAVTGGSGGIYGPISNGSATAPLILNSNHQIILSRRA